MNSYRRDVLKQKGKWVLERVTQTKYFKNGRPSLHVEVRYQVVCQDENEIPILGMPSVFHLTSKTTALKHFRIVTNSDLDALQCCNAIDHLYGKVVGE